METKMEKYRECFCSICAWMTARTYRVLSYGAIVAGLILLAFPVHGIQMPARARMLSVVLGQPMPELAHRLSGLMDHVTDLYFWMALLGDAAGVTEAPQVYDLALRGMLSFLFLATPFFVRRVFRSTELAVLSPFLLLPAVHHMFFSYVDWYFAPGIVVMLGCMMAIVLLTWQGGRQRWYWLGLAATALVAGWGNVMRLHAGLGVSLLALYAAWRLRHHFPQGRRTLAVALSALIVAVSYPMFTTILPGAFQQYYGAPMYVSLGPWHTTYIGLGWRHDFEVRLAAHGIRTPHVLGFGEGHGEDAWKTSDDYHDIAYLDGSAVTYVERHDPEKQLVYGSPESMRMLRARWLALWREAPGWMLANYAEKALFCVIVILGFAVYWAKWAFVLTLVLFFQSRRKGWTVVWNPKRFYVVPIFCVIPSLVFGLVATPHQHYLLGSIAGVVMMMYLALLDLVRSAIRERG